jgi:hypothetical protein
MSVTFVAVQLQAHSRDEKWVDSMGAMGDAIRRTTTRIAVELAPFSGDRKSVVEIWTLTSEKTYLISATTPRAGEGIVAGELRPGLFPVDLVESAAPPWA